MSTAAAIQILISANSAGVSQATAQAKAALSGLEKSTARTSAATASSWSRMGRGLDSAGKKMTTTGRTATRNLSVPILAAGAASVKMAVDFDSALSQISSLVGASDKQMSQYREGILDLARDVPQAPKELADALYFVTSSGFEGAAALDVLNASARASAAGLGRTMTVADAVTSAVNAYGEENLKAARATDILLAAVREGKAEPEELAGSIGRVIPVAADMGIEFHEVAGAMAAMSLSGFDAFESATNLSGIMSAFIKPGEQAKETLKKFGMTSDDVRESLETKGLMPTLVDLRKEIGDNKEALGKLFPNVRALRGFLNLTGKNVEKNADVFRDLEGAVGDTDRAFEKASKGERFQFQQDFNKLRIAAIELGEDLLPIAHDVVDVVTDMADAFNSLDQGTRNNIIKTAGALMLFGPALRLLGPLMRGGGWTLKKLATLAAPAAGASALGSGAAAVGGGAAVKGGAAVAAPAVGGAVAGGVSAAGIGAAVVAIAGMVIQAKAAQDNINDLTGEVEKFGIGTERGAEAANQATEEIEKLGASSMGMDNTFGNVNAATDDLQDDLEAASRAAAEQRNQARTAPFKAAIAPLETQLDLLRGVNGELSKSKQLELDRLVAAEDYKGAVKLLRGEVERSTEAYVKNNKKQWDQVDGWRVGAASIKKNDRAMKDFRKSGTGTMLALNKVFGNSRASANALKRANDAVGHGWESTAGKADKAAGATNRAGDAADRAGSKASGAKGKVDGLGRSLDGIKSPPPVNVTVNIGDAMARIAAVKGALGGIANNTSLGMTGLGPTGRAKGGPVDAMTPYFVGEKGMELFIPKTPGVIVPNHALKASTPKGAGRAGGRGRTVVEIHPKRGMEGIERFIDVRVRDGIEANESYVESRKRVNR